MRVVRRGALRAKVLETLVLSGCLIVRGPSIRTGYIAGAAHTSLDGTELN